ncbi:hypothetical protein ACU6U9_23200 [Pseudomonas sp. HK3]
MKKSLFLVTCLFFSIAVSAYTSHSGGKVNIHSLRAYSDDFVLFKSSGADNNDGCTGKDGWIQVNQNTPAEKRIFTLLLSARVSNQPVTLFFNGCSGNGTSGYRLVEQVML